MILTGEWRTTALDNPDMMFVDGSYLKNKQGIFCAGYAITSEYSAIEVAPLPTAHSTQIAE